MEQWLKSFIMTEIPWDPLISTMKWVTVNLGQNWCYAQYLRYTPHGIWSIRSDISHTVPTSWIAKGAPITTALPDPCVTWAMSISAGGRGRGRSRGISAAQCLTRTPHEEEGKDCCSEPTLCAPVHRPPSFHYLLLWRLSVPEMEDKFLCWWGVGEGGGGDGNSDGRRDGAGRGGGGMEKVAEVEVKMEWRRWAP